MSEKNRVKMQGRKEVDNVIAQNVLSYFYC